MSTSRVASAVFVAAMLAAGIGAAFYPAMMASRESRAFCSELSPGMSLPELELRATAAGYRFDRIDAHRVIVEHPRSLGRAYCEVVLDDKGAITTVQAEH